MSNATKDPRRGSLCLKAFLTSKSFPGYKVNPIEDVLKQPCFFTWALLTTTALPKQSGHLSNLAAYACRTYSKESPEGVQGLSPSNSGQLGELRRASDVIMTALGLQLFHRGLQARKSKLTCTMYPVKGSCPTPCLASHGTEWQQGGAEPEALHPLYTGIKDSHKCQVRGVKSYTIHPEQMANNSLNYSMK